MTEASRPTKTAPATSADATAADATPGPVEPSWSLECCWEFAHSNRLAHTPDCPDAPCERCGKPLGSFGCKVQHISLNTGDCKAAND